MKPERQNRKRIVRVNGEYAHRNFTVFDIINLKGIRQLTKTIPFLEEEAKAAEEAGIDTLNIRHDPNRPEISEALRKAAPNTFMSFAMPMQAAKSEYDALKLSFDAMEIGADSIICGTWGLNFISAVAHAGIPTEGHLGLVPRRSTWTGGLRAVGKTSAQAIKLYQDLKKLEDVGVWAAEIEVIPSDILCILTSKTKIVTCSIGGGPGDIQFLFAEDILGDSPGPFPRHSKQYADLYSMRIKMQEMRVQAFQKYIQEVNEKTFPSKDYEVSVKNDVKNDLIKYISKNTIN
tara:strand:- start:6091 stop:6960 length:870 start_codon:yes stop_codon:yes gene_type:complete